MLNLGGLACTQTALVWGDDLSLNLGVCWLYRVLNSVLSMYLSCFFVLICVMVAW